MNNAFIHWVPSHPAPGQRGGKYRYRNHVPNCFGGLGREADARVGVAHYSDSEDGHEGLQMQTRATSSL